MERMQQRIRQIAGGDQAKLARLKEILTWFDNEWEISRMVRAMWQCMRKSETAAMYMYSSVAVTPQFFEFIEYLVWAMEQIDSPEVKVRQRWWAYRWKVEHPEDNESIEYGVPFVRVQSQPEPQEYSFSHRKRRTDGARSLPRRSPRFPRRLPRFNGISRV
jgi:hypothetical protein